MTCVGSFFFSESGEAEGSEDGREPVLFGLRGSDRCSEGRISTNILMIFSFTESSGGEEIGLERSATP